jgi:Carboxypeptidase regulatory-like domain
MHLYNMKPFVLLLLFFLFCCDAGNAQVIAGKVIHRKTSKPVQAAIVTIEENKANGKQHFLQTDINGRFKISVKPAKYRLRIQMLGKCDTVIHSIEVKDTTSVAVEVILPPYCRYDATEKKGICPLCNKKKHVVPILYGLPAGEMDESACYYAGCEITCCDPHWYCKKHKITF